MDENRVEHLLVILRREEDLYARLRDVLRDQREVIATMDATEALERLTRAQEELCDEARLLEEGRLEVAAELAARFGLPPTSRLSEICEQLGPDAVALREAHNRLVIMVGVVRELIEANSTLLGGSISEVRTTLRALGSHVPEDTTYRPSGARARAADTGRLVRQCV